jgi:hypothetical protein
LPSEDLDSYRERRVDGASAGSVARAGGGGEATSGESATDPVAADTSLELPVSDPEPLDAGPSELATSDAATLCAGPGELARDDRCYLLSSESLGWLAARGRCRAWGGVLMIVGSVEEDSLLSEQLSSNAWIGLNDLALEGTFVWDGGAGATFRRWGDNEPNDVGGSDCVEKRLSDGFWYDQACALAKAFACEKALP